MSKRKLVRRGIAMTAVIAVAVVCGLLVGNTIAFFSEKKTDLSSHDVVAFEETIKDVGYKKGESPEDRLASEAFIIANYLLNQKEYYKIDGSGFVGTLFGSIGNLSLWGNAEKRGSIINTSIVAYNRIFSKYQVGLKYLYNMNTSMIDFYKGRSNANGSVVWGGSSLINEEQYFEEWGLRPTNFFPYVISSQTVIKNSEAMKMIRDGKVYYKFSMTLHPEVSIVNYAKQLQKMSGLSYAPKFSSILFEFIVDENFTFESVNIQEKYSVFMLGLLVNCSSRIDYDFKY